MAWSKSKINWKESDYYNFEDLDRVENNTIETAKLVSYVLGKDVGLEDTITNRKFTTIEFADSLNRIERNIQRLSVLNVEGLQQMKTKWKLGDSFCYKDANRLENNTTILHELLKKNTVNIPYCGTFYCGEDVI